MTTNVKYRVSAEDKTTRAFNNIKKNVGGVESAFSSLKGVAAAAFAGLSVAGFTSMVKGALDAGDKINKLSIRLGASTEALSQLKHVAELSGVSFNTLTMGLQRMTRRVAEAGMGTGEAVKALDELGLSAKELKTLAPEDQFEVIAQKISEVKDPADQVRLAMKLFDSEGVSLLQTMKNGAGGIKAMREEADKLGLTLSSDAAQGMADANDAMTRMRTSGTALANTMAVQLGPTIAEVADWFSTSLPDGIGVAGMAFDAFRHYLLEGVETIVSGLSSLSGKMASFAGYFDDDIAASLQATSEMYATMAKDVDELQYVYATTTESVRKFSVATQENAYSMSDLEGHTVSATQALKKKSEALKDTTKDLSTMGRAMDLIDAEFEKLNQNEAIEFAGLEKVKESAQEISEEAEVMESSFKGAFKSILKDGELDFGNLANSIKNKFLDIAVDQIFSDMFSNVTNSSGGSSGSGFTAALGSFFTGLFSAKGNVFDNGNVTAFATGGIVNSPTLFPMNSGAGLMGEAGPEAILPLSRGVNGKLGVQSAGSGDVTVNISNYGNTDVTQSSSSDSQGNKSIDIIITEKVNAAMKQGGMDKSMKGNYGINRRGY